MKKFLVDVPVMLNVWTRPHIQKRTFAPIKAARPSKLYLISDGPRNSEERKKLMESRSLVEDIDWECEVHKLYMEENQGMYTMLKKQYDFVFSREDRCIILEDDVLASVSFFQFCAELLEKYKDDLRITAINGLNHRGKWRNDETDYFFTHGNAILGYAMWKRSYDLHYRKEVFNDLYLDREMNSYVKYSDDDFIAASVLKQLRAYSANPLANYHPPAIEFYRSFINVTQSQVDIVPSVNMITNLGSEEGTHVPQYKLMSKRTKRFFYQKRYEINFPMRHPKYIIRDKEYEQWFRVTKLDILAMRTEVVINNIRYLPFQQVMMKVKKKLMRRKAEVEK